MSALIEARPARPSDPHPAPSSPVRDGVLVTVGGQVERVLGLLTTLALRWGLDPERLGVYTGLRLYLDNTNRSSLGVSLGAVQRIPILRAAGREAEARHLADVAHTANTVTCLVFAAGLLLWAAIRAPGLAGSALAGEWTWGLVAVAGLALLKRRQDFLIALLRAHGAFALTTRLAVLDGLLSAALTSAGLWLAGFWGLLASVGLLLAFNIAYLHARHPLRLGWAWDVPEALRLMAVGLPILANTAVFGAVQTVDRGLILWLVPHGERAAGLYTIALIGTNWSLDVAGRIVGVLYLHFQTTLGRTGDEAEVARQAARAVEAQAPLLAAGAAGMAVVGPALLGGLMPRYVEGLPALRPLLPGMVLLGLAWPSRQLLIAAGRPWRLCLATSLGLVATLAAGAVGALRAGMVGVAWGMSAGFAAVYLLTSIAALGPHLGARGWWRHQGALALWCGWFAGAGAIGCAAPLGDRSSPVEWAGRLAILAACALPAAVVAARRFGVGFPGLGARHALRRLLP